MVHLLSVLSMWFFAELLATFELLDRSAIKILMMWAYMNAVSFNMFLLCKKNIAGVQSIPIFKTISAIQKENDWKPHHDREPHHASYRSSN